LAVIPRENGHFNLANPQNRGAEISVDLMAVQTHDKGQAEEDLSFVFE